MKDNFDVFFRRKPALMLVSLKKSTRMRYGSLLAKEVDCTYSHAVKILQTLEVLKLVVFEKKDEEKGSPAKNITQKELDKPKLSRKKIDQANETIRESQLKNSKLVHSSLSPEFQRQLRDSLVNLLNDTALQKLNRAQFDEECTKVKGRQGTHAGYNAQIVVDEKHGLIINSDVVNTNSDKDQFTKQVNQANEILGKKCETACADSGYANTENLKETVEEEIEVIVPSQKQALHNPPKEDPFGKEKFKYDEKNNQYICPEEKVLRYSHYSKQKGHYLYRIKGPSNCKTCKHWGECTSNNRGRSIIRLKNENLKEKLEAVYSSEEGQAIYKKRKEKVELPFGHIKRNLNGGAFLLRGLKGVNAEMSLFSTSFNISRMITILGMSDIANITCYYLTL